jgi:hypothetical protein
MIQSFYTVIYKKMSLLQTIIKVIFAHGRELEILLYLSKKLKKLNITLPISIVCAFFRNDQTTTPRVH